MSEHGFHVHGPHDHELEHAAGGHGNSFTNKIAMFTAIIATVGAIFGYMGGATQAAAGLYKNDAAIKKTEASNQWNYYQAKSSKQNLMELALELAPASKADYYKGQIERYKTEKADIKAGAEKLEVQSKALAAIALLTRKVWVEYAMFGTGALGIAVGIMAALHI
jgi:hydroxylamine reductase (hybrid-cluster protein)